jgi:hypothetical protein
MRYIYRSIIFHTNYQQQAMDQYQSEPGSDCGQPGTPKRAWNEMAGSLTIREHQHEHFENPTKKVCTPDNRFHSQDPDSIEQNAEQLGLNSRWPPALNEHFPICPQQSGVNYPVDEFGPSTPSSNSIQGLLDQAIGERTGSSLAVTEEAPYMDLSDWRPTSINEWLPSGGLENYHLMPSSLVAGDSSSALTPLERSDLSSTKKSIAEDPAGQQEMDFRPYETLASETSDMSHEQRDISLTLSSTSGANVLTSGKRHEQHYDMKCDFISIGSSSSPSPAPMTPEEGTCNKTQILTGDNTEYNRDTCFGLVGSPRFFFFFFLIPFH